MMAKKEHKKPTFSQELTKERDITKLSVAEAKQLHELGMDVDITQVEQDQDGSKTILGRLIRQVLK